MVCFWSNLEKVIFLIFFTDVLLLETEALINLEKPQVTFYLELKHRSFFFLVWTEETKKMPFPFRSVLPKCLLLTDVLCAVCTELSCLPCGRKDKDVSWLKSCSVDSR